MSPAADLLARALAEENAELRRKAATVESMQAAVAALQRRNAELERGDKEREGTEQ